MLKLKQIKKDYPTPEEPVHALKGIDITFRANEFVSILGPSGCGKTTLLNIIGGLDRYTSGELAINGKSTTEFSDRDWDSYRNHSVGFVFQSYNLIPHQTVLSNVELALTLSGVKKKERRRRAAEVLEKVGLGDQLDKKPSQMSGGQMQRVAIARALVNDPDILLADEPTGALDTTTSVQVMDLLKEIAKDRLVIMVTHNPELAEQYSTRIVKLLDGELLSDSNPVTEAEEKEILPKNQTRKGKVSMSGMTALSLSLQNLLTKKGRTILTSFAGSIGIIGIALILALSNGIQGFINSIQQETLTSYPISILAEETDMSAMMENLMGSNQEASKHDLDAVYSNSVMYELINTMFAPEMKTNNLSDFRDYLLSDKNELANYTSAIHYSYRIPVYVYSAESGGNYSRVDIETLISKAVGSSFTDTMSSFSGASDMQMSMTIFSEILPGKDPKKEPVHSMVKDQYELVYGEYPKAMDEVVLVMNSRNEVSDLALYALGLKTSDELADIIFNAFNGIPTEGVEQQRFTYEEICKRTMKIILPTDVYNKEGDLYVDYSGNDIYMNAKASTGMTLKVVGIIKPGEDTMSASITGSFGYTSMLTEYLIDGVINSQIVKDQLANPDIDVFTGLAYAGSEGLPSTNEEKIAAYNELAATLTPAQKAMFFYQLITTPTEEEIKKAVDEQMNKINSMTDEEKREYASQLSAQFGVTLDETILDRLSDADPDVLRNILSSYASNMLVGVKTQMAFVPMVVSAMQSRELQIGYITSYYANRPGIDTGTLAAGLLTKSDEELKGILTQLIANDTKAFMESEIGSTILVACYDGMIAQDEATKALVYDMLPSTSTTTFADTMKRIGYTTLNTPSSISIYAKSFEDKELIASAIERYNETKGEDDKISYTDYMAILLSGVTSIVDFVSYGLIAFVSISLVVSSIMIGIITYISVIERTKEIGILRSIGASKRDIKRVFNAETLIVGFTAGIIGILTTLLLCIPISAIIEALSDVPNIASLPAVGGIVLVIISMLLTFIAGLLPAMFAANRDPVQALRSE
ncbi:MAG: ABC transporter ATP-binding protein/permease [Ruminococcaceae bacterium]|nr:ABC transporter ATP-binding protein/permease [Oscillospiraceae bacterium]